MALILLLALTNTAVLACVAFASVRNAVTDSSVVELVKEIEKIRTVPVSQEELDQAKAKYVGDFVLCARAPFYYRTICPFYFDRRFTQ